jgi:hypothetical protein
VTSAACRRAHGTVTITSAAAVLAPHAFAVVTPMWYRPGPTVPDIVRDVVGKLPMNAPVTCTV